MLKKSLVLLFLVGTFLLGPTNAFAGSDFLEPSKIAERIRKQIAKQKIGGAIDIIDGEIFEGISTGLGYRIKSEPSYVDGYYTRLDRYELQLDINAGDLIDDNDSPFGFGIRKENNVIFARQFKSQKESLTAIPYTFKNIPLTSQKAIRNLNPGDFVALEGNLSLTLSIGASNLLNQYAELSGSTHVMVSGEFLIHIFRMPDNKLRLKLISSQGKGFGMGGKLEMGRGLDIVGFKYIDRRIKSIIQVKPFSVDASRGRNELFMLDYIFDLNQSAAVQAYDDLMGKKSRFKDIALINPFESRKKMEESLLNDVSTIEDIAFEDRNLDSDQRRIDRVFRGSNSAVVSRTKFKLGFNFLRVEAGAHFAQNRVVFYNRDQEEQKFLLDTFSTTSDLKLLFGLFGDKTTDGSNILFSSDDSWKPNKFIALTQSKEIKMKTVSKGDYQRIKKYVQKLIPPTEFARIDWKNWNFEKGDKVNGYFKTEMFFQPSALRSMPRMDSKKVNKLITSYILATGRPTVRPSNKPVGSSRPGGFWIEAYEQDLMWISRYLSNVVGTSTTSEERYLAFKRLKSFPLWQERGQGFLLSLLPEENRDKMISYEMTFSAKGADAIHFKFGSFAEEELYRSLMYIQSLLDNRSYDLRMQTNSSSGELTIQ